ncbi:MULTISPECIES: hypothetical protein [unclassified Pseudomonas]|uniref:hypothetical protein n=1 Tax=unclassified Pseudomonas TaxID=196821 RepID=UPI0004884C3E|nr:MULTISPECIES: hypothetical protein [unclassified Pseudomonas]RAS29461.1 hypothetical protein H040_01600 [Pseudomonas sp. URMO17WK12:I7]SMF12335.1 hypothetical protein SAMN02745903_01536 [Pseudomonas sp. URMO17WK12:I5]
MTIRRNRIYTDLLRSTYRTIWGNWGLNTSIKPGAVGIIDTDSGDFKLVADCLPGVEISKNQQSRKWDFKSTGVTCRSINANVGGVIFDPSTGAEVKPDAALEWTFDKENSITSEFAIAGEHAISNLTVLDDQYDWLLAQARKLNMATASGISEGFGVVTSVIYASSGLNAAAKKSKASFTVSGSASGLNRLLGEGGISGKGKASYVFTSNSSEVETHTLPAKSGEVATEPLPVAYTFASFAGSRVLIPSWVGKIGVLNLLVDSKASSFTTYTTKLTLSYQTPAGPVEDSRTVVGGSSASFGEIPLTATEMVLTAEFINIGSNTRKSMRWNTPASEWLGGTRTVNLTGTWPGAPNMTEVES